MTTTSPAPDYIKPDDEFFVLAGFTKQHLAQLRYTGKGPKYLNPTPKTILYRRQDVIDWLEASERTITGDAA